jgi:hypothetical protein
MGFSISWIGFKALNKTEAIRRAGFRDTGSQDEANEAPYSAAALPTGWTILFSNDFDYGSAEHLLGLSLGTMVVACQAEEHIMYSAAHCSLDGRESGASGTIPNAAYTICPRAARSPPNSSRSESASPQSRTRAAARRA